MEKRLKLLNELMIWCTKAFKLICFFALSTSFLISIVSCRSSNTTEENEYIAFGGNTMGTSYSIKAYTHLQNLKDKVDSVLLDVNFIFSTYDSSSLISKLNNPTLDEVCIDDPKKYFYETLTISKNVFEVTNGHFDPTVMPLVNYWGFGPNRLNKATDSQDDIDSILQIIGFDKLSWNSINGELCMKKYDPKNTLDLNAVAKGKGVDIVAEMLDELKIEHYLVEIGGEIKAKGKNRNDEVWKIGIERPVSNSDLSNRLNQAIIQLDNQSIASSGNYRNFRQFNDRIIGHTINPLTGFPEVNDLLGVSVIANECARADAFATAFMAMGFEKAYHVAKTVENIKVFFVKVGEDGASVEVVSTNNFDKSIIYQNN